MIPNTVYEIDKEIEKLQERRSQLLNEDIHNKAIKKLEWLKDCAGRLEIDHLCAAGIPKYKIYLFGKTPDCSYNPIHIYGNAKVDEYNILYGKSFNNDLPCLYTSSNYTLIEFLHKYKFKKLDFDKGLLEVLKAVEEVSKI